MKTQSITSVREATDPHHLREGEARRLLANAPWRRFVVLGDGSGGGNGMCVGGYRPKPWADQVATALRAVRPDLAYRNFGKPGVSFADIRARWLVDALAFNGDLAAVSCGSTDVFSRSFDPDAVEVELSRIIAALRDTGCKVLVIGMYDITRACFLSAARRAALRARLGLLGDRIQAVSLRQGALHIDLTAHPANAERDIWCQDGTHISSRGHAIAAATAIRQLSRAPGPRV
jgi:hypothetical protein